MANKPLLAFVADVHLQEGAWAHRPILGDAKHSFKQVIDWAIHYKPERLIVLGDLFDVPKNRPGPINFLHSQLCRLEEADIPFQFIQGQPTHDKTDPPWASGHRWAHHLDTTYFEEGGRHFHALDYRDTESLAEALAGIREGTDILLAHQGWAEINAEFMMPQAELAQVPHVSVVVSGDLHQYVHKHFRGKDGQDILFISPGSIAQQEINEDPEKFFVVMLADGTFKKVPLKTRPVLRSDALHTANDLDAFLERIRTDITAVTQQAGADGLPEGLWQPLLHVIYDHKLENAPQRIEKIVGTTAHLFWREIKPEKVQKTFAVNTAEADGMAVTPLMLLNEVVDPQQEAPVHKLITRLLRIATKEGKELELVKWRQEFLEAK